MSQMHGVDLDSMRGMARLHRPPARLRHVADQQAVPASLAGIARDMLDRLEEHGHAPIAVAREPHHLPVLAVDRQRDGAGETAFGEEADGPRGAVRRAAHRAEEIARGLAVELAGERHGEAEGEDRDGSGRDRARKAKTLRIGTAHAPIFHPRGSEVKPGFVT